MTRIAWSLAVFVAGCAFAASLLTGAWHWFPRSGALIVILGILLTSSQIFSHLRRLQNRQGGGSVQHDWIHASDRRAFVEGEESIWLAEKSGLVLLISGTLIWAFGDLPGHVL